MNSPSSCRTKRRFIVHAFLRVVFLRRRDMCCPVVGSSDGRQNECGERGSLTPVNPSDGLGFDAS